MAYYYRYRKNGGEVYSMSVSADEWTPDTYFGVYETEEKRDLAPSQWCDGSEIRNATDAEIAAFSAASATDGAIMQRAGAKDVVDNTGTRNKIPVQRALRGLVELMVSELNTLRALHDLPERTMAQAKTALKNKIDAES